MPTGTMRGDDDHDDDGDDDDVLELRLQPVVVMF